MRLGLERRRDAHEAAELRVTLGQFAGAYGRVRRVDPLPGTVMEPGSCALTVQDPDSGSHLVYVAGVQDHEGFLDITSYPRAGDYGWPRSLREANVRIAADGTLDPLSR